MKTSRQRVLEFIQAHRAVTVVELCQALDCTEANMRHHLGILQEQGLVQVIGSRSGPNPSSQPTKTQGKDPPARRGRPARIYGLVEASPADRLESLVAALLEEVLPALLPEEREQFLDRLALRMADEMQESRTTADQPGPPLKPASLTARLYAAVEHLNAAHYQARWEARPDAPRLILGRCPFGDLPIRRPEICQLDARLLQILIGAPVDQTKRREKDARGLPYCLFRISKPRL